MKRLAIVLWIAATVVPARAADTVTIGYVDMRKVLNDSEAGQRVKAEVEKTVKQRQAALAKEQERLKAMQQAYEKDKLVLSEARQLEKQRELRDAGALRRGRAGSHRYGAPAL